MEDYGDIEATGGQPKNRLRDILQNYGAFIAIAVFIAYILLQVLYVNTFISHVLVVNIPQTTYPPDVVKMWDNLAGQMDQQTGSNAGTGDNTPVDHPWDHPQGPTQGTLAQLVPNLMGIVVIALIIAILFQWAIFAVAAFVLLKLLGKNPGWGIVSTVGCAFVAFIPFLAITFLLVSTMPVYTIDYANVVSHSNTNLLNNISNDAQFQLIKPVMLVGWICFGIVLISAIKVAEEVDTKQALIAGGIPVFLYFVYSQSSYILNVLHHFI